MSLSSFTVESVDDDCEVGSRLRLELDQRVDVPQISSLFELESNCIDGKKDYEFWRCIAIAASEDICLAFDSDSAIWPIDRALFALKARRSCEWPLMSFEEKEAAISGEINLFIQRFFQNEEGMTATTGKLKDKATKAKPETKPEVLETDDELLAKGKSRAKTTVIQTPNKLPVVEDIEVARIIDSPFQTRAEPSAESVVLLADSLARDGQRDDIRVRPVGDKFELIGGHRRLRAARKLEWRWIRATVLLVDDAQAARLVWDDNRQREDLNHIERAQGLRIIWEQYQAAGKSMDDMAKDVGIDQSTISNRIRLLAAPESLQERLISGEISETRLRGLAKWACVDGLLERFEKEITLRCESGPISKDHWLSSLRIAIESKSRQTKRRYHFAAPNDPLFPVDKYAEELDIREYRLDDDESNERRCFNVKRWDQLQKEAKAKLKEKQAKSQKSAATLEGPKPRKGPWVLNGARRDAWLGVLWDKIGETFNGKKTKPEKWMTIRLMHLLEATRDEWVLEALSLNFDEYVDKCIAHLIENWPDSYGWNTDWKTLEQIGSHFNVEIRSTWKPTKALLDACTKDEVDGFILEIREDVNEDWSKITNAELVEKWPPGFVPELLDIVEPQPATKGKTKC
jgi:ParB/RepB/Spo0J family partition protein